MKSYEDHLESLLSSSPTHFCHRASAIFPVFHSTAYSMELLFLNYWKLKRNIEHLLCRFYLRDYQGQLILKKCFYLDERRAYSIKLCDLVTKRYPFSGSLELEFCSPENLVFPYPAVVVYYKGLHFSTFVHSAQRTYNDEEDQKTNSRPIAIESGFNIYYDDQTTPFLTYIQGESPKAQSLIELAAYNQNQQVIGAKLSLKNKPFSTHYLSLKSWKALKDHLGGQPGCIKAKIEGQTSFPRLLVGNQTDTSLSITHTYYDLLQAQNEKDYWKAPSSNWDAASLALPLKSLGSFQTRIFFYPIYSPVSFSIDLEVYTLEGQKVNTYSKVYQQGKEPLFIFLDADSFQKDLDPQISYLFRLIAVSDEKGQIPSRIKIGYDVRLRTGGMACNICTNFQPANPSLEQKKHAFRWAPLMPQSVLGSIWCLNDAPQKKYTREAQVKMSFYRLKDAQKKELECTIAPRGAYEIQNSADLETFFQGEPGWCTFESSNPYLTTYYFSEHPSGGVGGDHGF